VTRDNFILSLYARLSEAGVPEPLYEAARYVIANPGIETEKAIADVAEDWLDGAADEAGWRDPAAHTP
jgi:hypothetical protein